MSKLHSLVGLVIAALILNQLSPGAGGLLMMGAFVLWFVAGDGLAQFQITYKKFLAWIPG